MNDAYRRAEAVFHDLLGQPAERRTAALAAACGDDEATMRRVRALLSAAAKSGAFLDGAPIAAEAAAGEKRGDRIGPYILIEALGEGGFGIVWHARQEHPMRREVALKIVKPGMDTREVVARFKAERQALAMMDHPHIAQVLEAGATERGRPYFVMELVRGQPLGAFCDAHGLPIEMRIAVFLQVCRAVQHAHQKGVIHRDLKPTNILVALHDGAPMAKVIDFGIAKALEQPLGEHTLTTAGGRPLGTPRYMAPEQLVPGARDIDTQADVYALGVVLCELLTGASPFAGTESLPPSPEEMCRRLRDAEPLRPSVVLAGLPAAERAHLARQRGTEPRALLHAVRGDLDWIVLRCVEKDRARRYATAHDLALDLERYLAQQPVTAVAPSMSYSVGKYLRRHKAGVALGVLFALLLVAGAGISTREALRARRAEREAGALLVSVEAERDAKVRALRSAVEREQHARDAEADTKAFGDFLVHRVLSAARSREASYGLGIDVTVVRALEAAEKTIEQDFAGRPAAEARTRHAIADTWRNVGRFADAEPHLRKAVARLEEARGRDHPETLSARNCLGLLLLRLGRPGDASAVLEPVVRAGGAVPYDLASPVSNLIAAYQAAGENGKALALSAQADAARDAVSGDAEYDPLASLDRLVREYRSGGDFPQALTLCAQALALRQQTLGARHPDVQRSMVELGRLHCAVGNPGQAATLFEQVLTRRRETIGAAHPDTLEATTRLAAAWMEDRQVTAAIALYEESLPRFRAALGAERPDVLAFMADAAAAHLVRGDAGRAVPLCQHVLEVCTRQLGEGHADTVLATMRLGEACLAAGETARAVQLGQAALALQRRASSPEHPDAIESIHRLALAYLAADRCSDAQPLLNRVLLWRQRTLGAEDRATLASRDALGLLHARKGELAQARAIFREVLAARRRTLRADAPETFTTLVHLGDTLRALRQPSDAIPPLAEAVAGRRARLGVQAAATVEAIHLLGLAHAEAGESEPGLDLLEEAVAHDERNLGTDAPVTLAHLARLAAECGKAGRHEKAVLLRETVAMRTNAKLGSNDPETLARLFDAALAFEAAGDFPKARAWFEQSYVRRKLVLGAHAATVASADRFARSLLLADEGGRAVDILKEGLALARRLPAGDSEPAVALLQHHLASALLRLRRLPEALAGAREAVRAFRDHLDWDASTASRAEQVLYSTLLALRRDEEARQELAEGRALALRRATP